MAIAILVAFLAVGGYFVWNAKHKPIEQSQVVYETATWKVYPGNALSFEYPDLLSLKQSSSNNFILTHSVPFTHPDPCDFRGDAPSKKEINDFYISFWTVDESPQENIRKNEDWNRVSKNPIKIGNLSGFKDSGGVEGCGGDIYYLIMSPNKTLIMRDEWVPEFSSVNGYTEGKYNDLSGIILPKQKEEILNKIISSFKFNLSLPSLVLKSISEDEYLKYKNKTVEEFAPKNCDFDCQDKYYLDKYPKVKLIANCFLIENKKELCNPEANIEDNPAVIYRFFGHASGLGYFFQVQHYEGSSFLVVTETGDEVGVIALPVLSPDGKQFVSTSVDLGAEYNPNGFQVWEKKGDSWVLKIEKYSGFGMEDPVWIDGHTFYFVKVFLDPNDTYKELREYASYSF